MSDERPVEDGTHHPTENTSPPPASAPKPSIPPPPVDAPPPPPPPAEEPPASPPPSPAAEPQAEAGTGEVPPASNEKMLAMLCHLLSLLGVVPPFNIVAPFILWLIKKDEVKAVDIEGRKSVNFQATVTVVAVALIIVTKVGSLLPWVGGIAGFLGMSMIWLLVIADAVLVVMAAMQINNGKPASYPFAYDFITLFGPKKDGNDEA